MVNMRPFTSFEQKNLRFLVNHNVKFTQVEITSTGLAKGILDATVPMRAYFFENNIHDYEEQLQGQEHKQYRKASVLTESTEFSTKVSFYRPNTKNGDPRMWIYGFGPYTESNDIHVMFWFDDTLYSINITHIDIEKCYGSTVITPIQDVLKSIYVSSNSVSDELLAHFKAVTGQWFESEVTADTGIGRTIESFLGIAMNSNKTPDWDISALKSGREIVEKYGYITDGGKLTYQNTVQCSPPNSQLLFLNVNQVEELLELQAKKLKTEDVAVWRLMKLHQRLLTKHHETFWIEVENVMNEGKEYFRYKQIEHTRNPNVGQFDVLLEQNLITIDLLLCRPSGHGDTYSFKIKKKGMPMLFPESIVYHL